MENKLSELKKTNNMIHNRIRDILNHGFQSIDIGEEHNYYPELKYHSENKCTSTNILSLKRGMISKTLSEDIFTRIICIKGSIKIQFIPFREEIIVNSPNTILIIPNTKYKIEVLEESEIINVYKY